MVHVAVFRLGDRDLLAAALCEIQIDEVHVGDFFAVRLEVFHHAVTKSAGEERYKAKVLPAWTTASGSIGSRLHEELVEFLASSLLLGRILLLFLLLLGLSVFFLLRVAQLILRLLLIIFLVVFLFVFSLGTCTLASLLQELIEASALLLAIFVVSGVAGEPEGATFLNLFRGGVYGMSTVALLHQLGHYDRFSGRTSQRHAGHLRRKRQIVSLEYLPQHNSMIE